MRVFFRVLPLILCCLLAACAGKKTSVPVMAHGLACNDLATLPQNLTVYAQNAGGNRPLASPGAQRAAAERQRERIFLPWTQSEPSAWVKRALQRNFNMNPSRAYGADRAPMPSSFWAQLEANANKAAFPSLTGPGISLRHTNIRAMPTSSPFYLDPNKAGEGPPFDYFQHSSIPMGTPLYLCNLSADRQWALVQNALTAGWVPAADVATVDPAFMERWQSLPLAGLIRDRVSIGGASEGVGALLPMSGPGLTVLYPVAGDSGGPLAEAGVATAALSPAEAAPVPLTLTPANVAGIGNGMMGQPYGWGGLNNNRDCSALTRDLLAPFGLWLPRNSASQAKVGRSIYLSGMSNAEKESRIMAEAVPFSSLIWLRGHIGLYLGAYQGKALMFHNIWGLRTRGAYGEEGRAVIGKAVVTSLKPGIERQDLVNPGSLLDRIEQACVLPAEEGFLVDDSNLAAN